MSDSAAEISEIAVVDVDNKLITVTDTTSITTTTITHVNLPSSSGIIPDDSTSINDSQSFNLVDDFDDETQLTKSKNDDEDVSQSQDEVVEGTPQKESISPLKRSYAATAISQESGVDDSDDEPASKMPKVSSQIIPESQKSQNDDEEDENVEEKNKSTIDDKTENITSQKNDADELSADKTVDNEPLQPISEMLPDILDDDNKMDIDEDDKGNADNTEIQSSDDDKNKNNVELNKVIEKENSEKVEEVKSNAEDDKNIENLSNNGTNDPHSHNDFKKSRMSIEVVYDKALAPPVKPKELVELDDDGEKIVLDSSHEDSNETYLKTSENKSSNTKTTTESKESDGKLANGSSDSSNKTNDSDRTASLASDISESTLTGIIVKERQPEVLNLISDSEGESFTTDDKSKVKTIPMEKEINVLVKVKCLLHVDDTSKELNSKEILAVYCENFSDFNSLRRRNSDTSNMADISDNKEPASPGSVTSNPQPFPLNPSRLSLMSLASSSSSSSSGSSKFPTKDNPFSLPRGVPKHAKKLPDPVQDDVAERLKKEWKNVNLISSAIVNFMNGELLTTDLHNGTNEQVDSSSIVRFRSSTPETSAKVAVTPHSTKKGKVAKRARTTSRSSKATNGVGKSPDALPSVQESTKERHDEPKIPLSPSTPSRAASTRSLGILRSYTPVYDTSDDLIGKKCFAKWSDNNYYPGTVVSKAKSKFKINFLDGKNKLLIEDFFVTIPSTLPINLSIYATTKNDDYGSCGMITGIDNKNSNDNLDTLYCVETDEGEKLKVQLKDIFLTADQVQILKEAVTDTIKSPSTPRPEKISLDNVIEGSRRTKSSSLLSTPKSSRDKARGKSDVEASSSGIVKILADDSESDVKPEDDDLGGIQPEISNTSSASPTKGPQSRVKGKGRSKKRVDDPETINLLGPIPTNTNLFSGMSFILTCAPLESLDKYKSEQPIDSNSEMGTDYEEEWTRRPFVRDRLVLQITSGGGKVYETFNEIPKDDYKNVHLITNVPNVTAKSLQCLSNGIAAYNHQWIIRCCQENKLLSDASEVLPAGWSLENKSYIEMRKRASKKPLSYMVIVIPKISVTEKSLNLWQQVIENAGGTVQFIDNPTDVFDHGTVVLTNRRCPNWIIQKADSWNIPLVSSTWIIQCLVEGKLVPHNSQQAYSYNYVFN